MLQSQVWHRPHNTVSDGSEPSVADNVQLCRATYWNLKTIVTRRFRSTHKQYTVQQLLTNLGGLGSSESVAVKTLHLRDLYNLDNANMAELFRDRTSASGICRAERHGFEPPPGSCPTLFIISTYHWHCNGWIFALLFCLSVHRTGQYKKKLATLC